MDTGKNFTALIVIPLAAAKGILGELDRREEKKHFYQLQSICFSIIIIKFNCL